MKKHLNINYTRLSDTARVPQFTTAGAAAADVFADNEREIIIGIGERMWIPTNIALEIPEGYCAQVCSRSGIAGEGIYVANTAGLIDSDYRGEIKVLLANGGDQPYTVHKYSRIAQLLFQEHARPYFHLVEKLGETERGENGFGSTGGFSIKTPDLLKNFWIESINGNDSLLSMTVLEVQVLTGLLVNTDNPKTHADSYRTLWDWYILAKPHLRKDGKNPVWFVSLINEVKEALGIDE